jgi:sugar-specific transcriptional regulator TrmB/vacuolar-type H+-ATPase subunit E/Vma4
MAENVQYIKDLTGLEKEDLRVYAEMLRHGFGTAPYLAEYTGIKEKKVNEIIQKLTGKNLVKKMPGAVSRYIPMRPYGELVKYLETFYTEAATQQKQLNEFNTKNTTQFSTISQDLNKQTEELLSSFEKQLAQIQTDSKGKIDTTFETTKSKTLSTAQQIPTRLAEKLGNVISEFQAKSTQARTDLDGSIKKATEDVDGKIRTHLEMFQKQSQEIGQKLTAENETTKKNLTSKIETMKSGLSSAINEYKNSISKSLEGFLTQLTINKKQSEEQVQKVVSAIQSGLIDSQNMYQTEWETFKSESKTMVTEMNNKIIDIFTNAGKMVNEQLSTYMTTTTKNLTDFRTQIQKECDQAQANVQTTGNQLNDTVSQAVKQMVAQCQAVGTQVQTQLANLLANNNQKHSDHMNQLTTTAIKQITGTLDTAFSQLNNATEKFKARIKSEADREVERFKSEAKKSLGGNIEAYLKKLEEQAKFFQDVFKDQTNDYVVDVDDIYDKKRKELETNFASNPELVTQLEQFLTDNINKLKKLQDQFKTKFTDAISKEVVRLKADGKAALEKLQNDYILQVEAQGNLYQQAFKDEVAKVVNGIESGASTLKNQFTTELNKEKDTQIAANAKETAQTQESTKNEINQWTQTLINETEKMNNTVTSINSEKTTGLVNKIKQLANISMELCDSSQTAVSNLSQSNIKALSDSFNQAMETLKGQLIEKMNGWEQMGETRKAAIQQILTGSFDAFQKEIMRKVTEEVQVPILTTEAIHGSLDNGEQQVKNSAKTHLDEVIAATDNVTTQWSGTVQNLHDKLIGETDQLKATNLAHQTALSDKITSYQADIEKKFKDSVEAVATTGGQELSVIEGEIQKDLSAVKGGLDQTLADLSNQISTQVHQTQTSVKDKLATSENQLEQKTQEIFKNTTDLVQKIVIASEKPLRILKQSWMDMQAMNLLAIDNTWVLPGQQGIMPFITEMMERTQKSLKLVVPDLDALDVKELQNKAKKGINVTIITNAQKSKKNKPEKVAEKGIQLFDSLEDDLYIAIRDEDQEVLLAPMSTEKIEGGNIELGPDGADEEITISAELRKKLGEKVGIVSLQSEFVKKLNRLVGLIQTQAKKL